MSEALQHLLEYPLLNAIFGCRARRFGLGKSILSGPLAYTSRHDPVPLSELERSLLLAAGTGVSDWNFGTVPRPGSARSARALLLALHGPHRADGGRLRYTRDARHRRRRDLPR